MHGILFVLVPRSEARGSLQARKLVCGYLSSEGFALDLRFGGVCDYFGVGGRYSGMLNLLRLRHEQPRQFARFWRRYYEKGLAEEAASQVFREYFPHYRGKPPFNRGLVDHYGKPDDAQVVDEPLFQQLRSGFGDEVIYSHEIENPNVINIDGTSDFEWPMDAEEASNYWVVLIDYHF
jgi:hypothetical protein